MSIVLITGSSGLIGSESAFFFLKKGFKVIGIDNNLRKTFFGKDGDTLWIRNKLVKNKDYTHFNCDIRNPDSIKNIFKKFKKNISIVIHAAAQPSHDYAKDNLHLDFKVNAEGSLNIFHNIQKFCPESKVIFLSTNKVLLIVWKLWEFSSSLKNAFHSEWRCNFVVFILLFQR